MRSPASVSSTLKQNPSDDLLSEAEDELPDEISDKSGKMNRWALVDFVHTLPEWKDPDGSAFPIRFAEILAAQKKTPEQIRAIENELEALSEVQRHLGPRRFGRSRLPLKTGDTFFSAKRSQDTEHLWIIVAEIDPSSQRPELDG
jgi:hypothetical protein